MYLYIYIYIYIICTLFDHFKEGAILKRVNHPRLRLWYRGERKKIFHLTHKESIKKTKEAMTPSLDTVKLCASKYYIERSRRQCKN